MLCSKPNGEAARKTVIANPRIAAPLLPSAIERAFTRGNLAKLDFPDTFVDIELHGAFIAHLQQQYLAFFLALDVDALHDVENGHRLLGERGQYFLLIGCHFNSLVASFIALLLLANDGTLEGWNGARAHIGPSAYIGAASTPGPASRQLVLRQARHCQC
jgi:hypothetical protein